MSHVNVAAMKPSVLTSWLDLLLIFIPVTIVLAFVQRDHLGVFISAALAIIPLAGLLGRATEHLTAHVGAGVGGLLNASLGNAAELIIALAALREGLHDVVKASLTGSILGNILLVLGASMTDGRGAGNNLLSAGLPAFALMQGFLAAAHYSGRPVL